jgi:hypothetical protein
MSRTRTVPDLCDQDHIVAIGQQRTRGVVSDENRLRLYDCDPDHSIATLVVVRRRVGDLLPRS